MMKAPGGAGTGQRRRIAEKRTWSSHDGLVKAAVRHGYQPGFVNGARINFADHIKVRQNTVIIAHIRLVKTAAGQPGLDIGVCIIQESIRLDREGRRQNGLHNLIVQIAVAAGLQVGDIPIDQRGCVAPTQHLGKPLPALCRHRRVKDNERHFTRHRRRSRPYRFRRLARAAAQRPQPFEKIIPDAHYHLPCLAAYG